MGGTATVQILPGEKPSRTRRPEKPQKSYPGGDSAPTPAASRQLPGRARLVLRAGPDYESGSFRLPRSSLRIERVHINRFALHSR
jgi:hypothetical protein